MTSQLRQFSSNSGGEKEDSSKSSSKDDNAKDEEEEFELPLLMDGLLPRGMPNLWYSLKNFYLINFVLRTQIDKSFDIKEFIDGAKQVCFCVLMKAWFFNVFYSRLLSSFQTA